jgi:hypothetical protein
MLLACETCYEGLCELGVLWLPSLLEGGMNS